MDVNEEHLRYCSNPTEENLARLFNATREYAIRIGQESLDVLPGTYWRHACENAASTVLLDFDEKFDPQKGSFSTWSYQSIRRDLIDWRRGKIRRLETSLDAPDFDHSNLKGPEEPALVDNQLLVRKIFSMLSEDEQYLCEMKIDGCPLNGIASTLGVSLATVKRRWKAIVEKSRSIGVR